MEKIKGVSPEVILNISRNQVERISNIRKERRREYPSLIEVVFVFSGPGNYDEPLKEDQEDWMRWMDRDRIRAGGAIVREITASTKTLAKRLPKKIKTSNLSKEDVEKYGPYLVYNGIPSENKFFREVVKRPFNKIPEENIIVLDDVILEDGSVTLIRHTGDQVKSLFQSIDDEYSPLFNLFNIAIVANEADYIRNLHYISKENTIRAGRGKRRINVYPYAVMSRRLKVGKDSDPDERIDIVQIPYEEKRLLTYAKKGDLEVIPEHWSFPNNSK